MLHSYGLVTIYRYIIMQALQSRHAQLLVCFETLRTQCLDAFGLHVRRDAGVRQDLRALGQIGVHAGIPGGGFSVHGVQPGSTFFANNSFAGCTQFFR